MILAFLEGFCVLGIELLAHRMVAPAFGATNLIWTIVLGVTTLALTAGYTMGGILLRRQKKISLMWSLLVVAIWLVLCNLLMESWLSSLMSIENYLLATTVAVGGLLFVPLAVLGLFPPMLVEAIQQDNSANGKLASRVFFFSTVGAVVGCYLFGFLLIPEAGVKNTIFLIASFLMAGAWLISGQKRIGKIAPATSLLLLVGVFFGVRNADDAKVLYRSEGLLGQVLLADLQTNYNQEGVTDRVLFVNRMGQTWIDTATGESRWGYVNYVLAGVSHLPPKSNVLLIGLGGGQVAKKLHESLNFQVDAVELDDRISKVAKEYMGLPPEVDVAIDDGRHYLHTTRKKYDAIIIDAFKGEVPPGHLFTLQSFTEVFSHLNENGLLVINFNGFINGEKGVVGRSLYRTLIAAGYFVHVLPTSRDESDRNNVFFATRKPYAFDRNDIMMGSRRTSIASLFFNDPQLMENGRSFIFTDGKTLLEHLNVPLSRSWRKSYQQNFKQAFERNNIPLYE